MKRERDERSLTSRLVYSSNLPSMSSGVAPQVLVAGRTAPAEAEVEAGRRSAGRQAPAEKRVWGVILHQLVVAAGPSGRGDSRSRVLANRQYIDGTDRAENLKFKFTLSVAPELTRRWIVPRGSLAVE